MKIDIKIIKKAAKEFVYKSYYNESEGTKQFAINHFIYGAEWALKNQWHEFDPNSDDLPQDCETVLVQLIDGSYHIEQYSNRKYYFNKDVGDFVPLQCFSSDYDSAVARWMSFQRELNK